MFLCRAGRLSAGTADPLFRSFLVVRVTVNRHREVTVTAHQGPAVAPRRGFRAPPPGLEPAPPAHLERLIPGRHASCCGSSAPSERVHLVDRLPLPLELLGPAQPDIIGLLYARRRHKGLFTGSTMAVQTRSSSSSSTSAAGKRSEEEEEKTDRRREDVQTSREDSAASSPEKSPGEAEPEGGKPSKTQQLKKVFKEYGAVGVSFHVVISLMSLGMFYLLISSGIDMASLLCKLGFSEAMVQSKMAAGTSTFVLAYAVHKLFAPARISITLVSVPLIVRYLRKTGLFKPPTPAP